MLEKSSSKTRAALALVLLFQTTAWANAGGTLETDEEYEYNAQLYLRFETGDACSNAGSCFQLTSKLERPGAFRQIFGEAAPALAGRAMGSGAGPAPRDVLRESLWRISVSPSMRGLPSEEPPELILAQRDSETGPWLVYDSAAKSVLLDGATYPAALAFWKSKGNQEPYLITANDPPQRLSLTWRSRVENSKLVIFIGLVLALATALFLVMRSLRSVASRRQRVSETDV